MDKCPECNVMPSVEGGYLCLGCWMRITSKRLDDEGKEHEAQKMRRQYDKWRQELVILEGASSR